MPKLALQNSEIDLPQEVFNALEPIVRDVAAGRLPVMDAREIAGFTVDVGGRGIPYSAIRIRFKDQVYVLNSNSIAKLSEEFAENSAKTDPSAKIESTEKSEKKQPDPPALGTKEYENIFSELIALVTSFHDSLTDHETESFTYWLKKQAKLGTHPAVEKAIIEGLESTTLLPALRAKLLQCAWSLPNPDSDLVRAVSRALADRMLSKHLQNPKIRVIAESIKGLYSVRTKIRNKKAGPDSGE